MEPIVLWIALMLAPMQDFGLWNTEAECKAEVARMVEAGAIVTDCQRVEFKVLMPEPVKS